MIEDIKYLEQRIKIMKAQLKLLKLSYRIYLKAKRGTNK